MSAEPQFLRPEQLRVGLFVELDLSWMEHPFAFSRFKIRSQQQIDTLRELGLEQIRWHPERSDCAPLPADPSPAVVPAVETGDGAEAAPPMSPALQQAIEEKRTRVEQLRQIRDEIAAAEQRFTRAADALKQISRDLRSRPEQALEQADAVVSVLADTAFSEGDVKIHAISQQLGEDVYFHSLNVAVLAMILGRAVHLKRDELQQLGLGALLHDIGHIEVPDPILAKREALSRAEQAVFELHCRHGLRLAGRLALSEPARAVIAQHHEHIDGSGYPERLQGSAITLFSRIVAIVNRYDNLCNPAHGAAGITPYEALSRMYARERQHFDEELLRRLIRCLGVYPPGSLVELSDDSLGLVLSVDPEQPLRPDVMLYDPDVPKEAALIVKLAEDAELKIRRSLRAATLPPEVRAYLNPRARVTYYVEPQGAQKPPR